MLGYALHTLMLSHVDEKGVIMKFQKKKTRNFPNVFQKFCDFVTLFLKMWPSFWKISQKIPLPCCLALFFSKIVNFCHKNIIGLLCYQNNKIDKRTFSSNLDHMPI